MGKLRDITWKKTNRGTVEICGKLDKGNYVLTGCIEIGLDEAGNPIAIGGSVKDDELARELKRFAKENIKVR